MDTKESTLGSVAKASTARAIAELDSSLSVLIANATNTDGYNPLSVRDRHLVEAIDAILDIAGSNGGVEAKASILQAAAMRHMLIVSIK